MKCISVKCPECNATLDVEEGRTQIFCSYCGNKILLQNENEYIYRHIDEAKVTEAQTDQIIRLKEMEINQKNTKIRIIASIVLGVICLLLETIGSFLPEDNIFSILGLVPIVAIMYIWLFSLKNK